MCSCSQPPALAAAHFPAFLSQKENKKEESLPRSSASVCSLSNYRPFHSSPLLLSLFPPDINRLANAALDLVASSRRCGCSGLVQGQTTAGCYRKGLLSSGSQPRLISAAASQLARAKPCDTSAELAAATAAEETAEQQTPQLFHYGRLAAASVLLA